MSLWTIRLLKRIDPERRLVWAVRLFWLSTVGGIISSVVIASTAYERILMGISWAAITITCVDIVISSDVRDEL